MCCLEEIKTIFPWYEVVHVWWVDHPSINPIGVANCQQHASEDLATKVSTIYKMPSNGDTNESSDENEHHSVDADSDIDIDAKVDDDHDSEAKSEANEEGPHQSIDGKSKPSHLSSPSASLSCLHSIPEFDDDDDDEKYEVHSIVFYWFNSNFFLILSV